MADLTLPQLRQRIHDAQRELAPISRDDIYALDALRALVFQDLPDLYAALRIASERRSVLTIGDPS